MQDRLTHRTRHCHTKITFTAHTRNINSGSSNINRSCLQQGINFSVNRTDTIMVFMSCHTRRITIAVISGGYNTTTLNDHSRKSEFHLNVKDVTFTLLDCQFQKPLTHNRTPGLGESENPTLLRI